MYIKFLKHIFHKTGTLFLFGMICIIIGVCLQILKEQGVFQSIMGNIVNISEQDIQQQTEIQTATGENFNDGNISTGATITSPSLFPETSPVLPEKKTFIQKLESDYLATIYTLPLQSTKLAPGMSYNERSKILVDYMSKNTIRIPNKKAAESYIYIKLHKKPDYPIFAYWHHSSNGYGPRSGDLILNEAIEKISETEYIFDTGNIPYIRYYNKQKTLYNWKQDIDEGKSLLFAISSKAFDGNYIEKIIFYTKKSSLQ